MCSSFNLAKPDLSFSLEWHDYTRVLNNDPTLRKGKEKLDSEPEQSEEHIDSEAHSTSFEKPKLKAKGKSKAKRPASGDRGAASGESASGGDSDAQAEPQRGTSHGPRG